MESYFFNTLLKYEAILDFSSSAIKNIVLIQVLDSEVSSCANLLLLQLLKTSGKSTPVFYSQVLLLNYLP